MMQTPPLLSGKLGEELTKTLQPNETVLAATQTGAAALVATDQRVIIIKTAAALGKLFGGTTASFAYQQITSVDVHKQVLSGYVEITGGGVGAGGGWGTKQYASAKDRNSASNTFVFSKMGDGETKTQQVVSVIREQITLVHAPKASVAQAVPGNQPVLDIPEQIKKLASLRDAGALSDAEFEAKKAELLSRM